MSRYYISLPWCCPSRATILRGQYAHNTGIWTVSPPRGGFAVFHRNGLERSTIATWLDDAGYRTGLFGKYLNGYHNGYPLGPRDPRFIPPGWDSWTVPAGGSPYRGFDYTLNVDGRLERHQPAERSYIADVLAERAEEFVSARDRSPFFAYIATYNPHRPAIPAPRHAGMFGKERAPRPPSFDAADMAGKPAVLRRLPRVTRAEERRWDGLYRNRLRSLQAVDEMIGGLVDALAAKGRLDDTYFVFTSDNGHHIGQHRLEPGKNTPYEEDVRVPFIVRGPGIAAGGDIEAIGGNADVAPTLADLAGIRVPAFVDGRSLAPALLGRPGAAGASVGTGPGMERTAYLLEQAKIPGAPINPRRRMDTYPPPFTALRTRRHLYVEYATGERELYDVAKDQYQMHNIAPGNPLVARLSARLHRLRSCAGEVCRAIEAEP
jgi:arylsulfatase A-like enzyme